MNCQVDRQASSAAAPRQPDVVDKGEEFWLSRVRASACDSIKSSQLKLMKLLEAIRGFVSHSSAQSE